MKKEKIRIDTSGPPASLTSNPFAELLGNLPETPVSSPAPASSAAPRSADKPAPGFRIAKTRKGGYPIFLEKRAAGKTVTVLRNLSGDTESLLSLLKKRCAAGGKAFEDSIEIQGDHCAKVEAFLREQSL